MTENFNDAYAQLYDQMYASKNYKAEADFILELLEQDKNNSLTVLNLGCGTGNHDLHLRRAGLQIEGFDRSSAMIAIARAKIPDVSCEFKEGDITSINTGKKYDAVISLFHVLSYLTEDSQVEAFFQTMKRHMKPGSRAIVDYWYAPAVLKAGPQVTRKTFQTPTGTVLRIATPQPIKGHPVYDVNIKLEVTTGEIKKVHEESHKMRYFSSEEISQFSSRAGLALMGEGQWMHKNLPPDDNSWSVYAVFEVM